MHAHSRMMDRDSYSDDETIVDRIYLQYSLGGREACSLDLDSSRTAKGHSDLELARTE